MSKGPEVTFSVGFAPMGCYLVREEDGISKETVWTGIKSYAQAVKIAERMERDAAAQEKAR